MPRRKTSSPRSMWRGSITFGLVNVPVRLQPAVRSNDVRFHMLHDQDRSRLQRKMVCPVEDKEIPFEHVVKGYEVSPGRHVIVEKRELEALAPRASRAIEVLYFSDMAAIDPIYFQHPYYLVPDVGSDKAFELLAEAMRRSGKAAIVRFVMREKEYVGAVRATDKALILETMYHADEIVPADEVDAGRSPPRVGERELKVARQLIESLTADFEPEKLRDEYRQAVLKLVEKKAAGEEIELEPESPPKKTQVADILSALEESLAQAKSRRRHPVHA